MKFEECGLLDEVFSHEDEDGTLRHINATQLYAHALKAGMEKVWVTLDPAHTQFILENRGIERPRVDRLVEPYLSMPILVVKMADGSHLTVDGHHRWVKCAELGRKEILCLMVPVGEWEKFCVDGISEDFGRTLLT